MAIGEETAAFRPEDLVPMVDWVDTRWPPSLAESVKALKPKVEPEVGDRVESGPKPRMLSRLTLAQTAGVGAVLVLAAIMTTAFLGRQRPSPNLLTSIPTTSTIPPIPDLFTSGVDQVPFVWNEAAASLGLDLFLLETPGPNRLQMNLAEGLILYATEDPSTGNVRTLMLAAGPTEGEEDGDAVLAAWGTLIAAVNPERDGAGRRALLEELGVQPDRPLPNGISSQAVAGGASYDLRSGVLGGRALLVVTPNR
jgi:hypothetical protein